jgi:hypothetical protein
MKQEVPTLDIDRSVFKKSQQERDTLKNLKKQHRQSLQTQYGEAWKKHSKPVKLT